MSSINTPAIVLVHGAWHTSTHFSNVIEELQSTGYEVVAPTGASVSGKAYEDALSEDTAILKAAIESVTNKGKNVILVMHSYGGIYGSDAVAEWHLDPQNSQPGKGRIVHLLYISALILPKGVSLIGDKNTMHTLSLEDGLLHHMEPFHRFYEHVPLPQARKCMSQLQPHDAGSFSTPAKHRGWADHGIPVTYLACKQDRALYYDPDLLKFAARLKEAGVPDLEVVELDTDHTPWLSREREFMEVLWKVVRKVEEEGKDSARI